jgi:hypothetical protein
MRFRRVGEFQVPGSGLELGLGEWKDKVGRAITPWPPHLASD